MWKELIDSKEALLFDLDGTLIDSMGVWHKVDVDFFAKYGLDLPDDYQECVEGLSMYETAKYTKERFNLKEIEDNIIEIWNKMAFYEYSNNVQVKESVIELLKYCKLNNIKLAIATSNSRKLCEEVLTQRGIVEYFDVILTGDDCIAGKPRPDIYIKAADELKVSYDKCLVFEDICRGIEAGLRAGMDTVAVWDDFSRDYWEDKKKLANYYLRSYKEIIDEIYR